MTMRKTGMYGWKFLPLHMAFERYIKKLLNDQFIVKRAKTSSRITGKI
ncbi:hypothetical protein [Peribacillus deserti]|nr:hypothetical protein [Peribacillus deserti]